MCAVSETVKFDLVCASDVLMTGGNIWCGRFKRRPLRGHLDPAPRHAWTPTPSNLAARLQGVAEPSAVVVAESTRRLAGNLFELEDPWPHRTGVEGSVRV